MCVGTHAHVYMYQMGKDGKERHLGVFLPYKQPSFLSHLSLHKHTESAPALKQNPKALKITSVLATRLAAKPDSSPRPREVITDLHG